MEEGEECKSSGSPDPFPPAPSQMPRPDPSLAGHCAGPMKTVNIEGITKDITQETLEMYFENERRSEGGEIKSVKLDLKKGMALIEFADEEAAVRVSTKKTHVVNGKELQATLHDETHPSNMVKVTGLSPSVAQETIEMYFESKKRSNGGDITDIRRSGGAVYITFQEPGVAQNVAAKTHHSLLGVKLTVQLDDPVQHGGDKMTLVVKNYRPSPPEIVSMYFENKRRSGGGDHEMKEEKGNIYLTFQSEEVVERVLNRCPHKVEGKTLTVTRLDEEAEDSGEDEKPRTTISVSGYKKDCCDDLISLYFENRRKSGGGDIVGDIRRHPKKDIIYIEFENEEVAKRVVSRTHTLNANRLKVELVEPQVMYRNKALISGVPEIDSSESLEHYLEGRTKKDVSQILFGEEPGEVVVSFGDESDGLDFAQLEEQLAKKPFKHEKRSFTLKVSQVPQTKSVTVQDIAPGITEDQIRLYFENKRRSGGGDVSDVVVRPEEKYAVVIFTEVEAAEAVCQREHTISKVKVKASLCFECLGEKGGSLEPPVTRLPDPLTMSGVNRNILRYLTSNEYGRDVMDKALEKVKAKADVDVGEGVITFVPAFDLSSPDAKSLVKTWTGTVEECWRALNDCLEMKTIQANSEIWTELKSCLKPVDDKFQVYTEDTDFKIVVVGPKAQVSDVASSLETVKNTIQVRCDKRKTQVSDKMELQPPKLMLLVKQGILDHLRLDDLKLNFNSQTGEITLTGQEGDIRKAKTDIWEEVNKIKDETVVSHFTPGELEFLRQEHVHRFLQKQMDEHSPSVEGCWEKGTEGLKVYFFTNKGLEDVKRYLKGAVKETVHILDEENMPLLQSTKYKQLIDQLTREHDQRLCVQTDLNNRQIVITTVNSEANIVAEQITDFLKMNSIYNELFKGDKMKIKFVILHCQDRLKMVETDLKDILVNFTTSTRPEYTIRLESTKDGCPLAKQKLLEIVQDVKCHKRDLERPGLKEFLKSEEILQQLEKESRCVIDIDGGTNFEDEDVYEDLGFTHSIPFECQFDEDRKLQVVVGEMTSLAVDVEAFIVEVSSKLNSDSKQSWEVMQKAGDRPASELRRFARGQDIMDGEVFCTSPGNLRCSHIIHVVGPCTRYRQKDTIASVVVESLQEAVRRNLRSVALPSFFIESVTSTQDALRGVVEGVYMFYRQNRNSSITDTYLCLETWEQCHILWDIAVDVFGPENISNGEEMSTGDNLHGGNRRGMGLGKEIKKERTEELEAYRAKQGYKGKFEGVVSKDTDKAKSLLNQKKAAKPSTKPPVANPAPPPPNFSRQGTLPRTQCVSKPTKVTLCFYTDHEYEVSKTVNWIYDSWDKHSLRKDIKESFNEEDALKMKRKDKVKVAKREVSRTHTLNANRLKVELVEPQVMYRNKALISGVPEIDSSESLEHYLEGRTKRDVSQILFGEEAGEVVVSFVDESNGLDFAEFEKQLGKKPFKQGGRRVTLKVSQVPQTRSVTVQDIPPGSSEDQIRLYFENKRRSGGGDVSEVILRPEEKYAVVTFAEVEVAEAVCQREHTISKVKVKASLCFECLGEKGGSLEPPVTRLPDPLTMSGVNRNILRYLTSNEYGRDVMDKALEKVNAKADVDVGEGVITFVPAFDLSSPDAKTLVKTWTRKVEESWRAVNDCLEMKSIQANSEIWTELKSSLMPVDDKFQVYTEETDFTIVVVGPKAQVSDVASSLETVKNTIQVRCDKRKTQVSDMMELQPPKLMLLVKQGILDHLRLDDLTLNFNSQTGEITLTGQEGDITKAKTDIYEEVNKIKVETVVSHFTPGELEFLRKEHVQRFLQKQVDEHSPSVEGCWEKGTEGLKVYFFTNKGLEDVKRYLKGAVKETVHILDEENMPLLQSTKYKQRIDQLTREHAQRLCVQTDLNNRQLVITTVSSEANIVAEQITDFLKMNSIYSELFKGDKMKIKFVIMHCQDHLKMVETDLKDIPVNFTTSTHPEFTIWLESTKDGCPLAKRKLKEIVSDVKCYKRDLKRPGLKEFLKSDEILQQLEKETRCVIDIDGGTNFEDEDVYEDLGFTHSIPFECQFDEDRKLLVVVGEMTSLAGDVEAVIVEVSSNLNSDSRQSWEVMQKAGDRPASELRRFARGQDIMEGEVFCTSPGNLGCSHIIHVVGPCTRYRQKDTIASTVVESLQEAVRMNLRSVALPSFFTGSVTSTQDALRGVVEGVYMFYRQNRKSSITDTYLCLETWEQCHSLWDIVVDVFGPENIRNNEEMSTGGNRRGMGLRKESMKDLEHSMTVEAEIQNFPEGLKDIPRPRILLVEADMGVEEAFEVEHRQYMESIGGKVPISRSEMIKERKEELDAYRIKQGYIQKFGGALPKFTGKAKSIWNHKKPAPPSKKPPVANPSPPTPTFSRQGTLPRSQYVSKPTKVTLCFYTHHEFEVSKAVNLVYKSWDKKSISKKIKDLTIKQWTAEQIQSLKETENKYFVSIKVIKSQGLIEVFGLKDKVADANIEILNLIRKIEREQKDKEYAEDVQRLVQWSFEEVDDDGEEHMKPYPPHVNVKIEGAYTRDKLKEFRYQGYVFDFENWVEYPIYNEKDTVKMIRKDKVKAANENLPGTWDPMASDRDMEIKQVKLNSSEFLTVKNNLTTALGSVAIGQIKRVDRIQSKTLYQQYQAKKEQLTRLNPGVEVERTLWHGTNLDAAMSIAKLGFNRSYCDKEQNKLGEGVYFTSDAGYATRSRYAPADAQGKRRMFQSKVLTGTFTQGKEKIRVPPPRDGSTHDLYDSVVDDPTNPKIFVIFGDTQAYPEYLITFQ